MRLGFFVGAILTTLFVVVLAVGTVVTVVNSQQKQAAARGGSNASCEATVGPSQSGGAGGGADEAGELDQEQRSTVGLIISVGKERNLSPIAWQVAIQAGMTESRLRNLNHGDRDSLGIFQMRPSQGWGSVAQVTNPPYQVNKFFDVLEGISGWEKRRPGESAQAVERSGFPDRYHKWESMAVHLVENLGDVQDASGCGKGSGGQTVPPSEASSAAIQFAKAEQGKPYVWGATGPDTYDCSGLTMRAFEAAGITLPRVSREQYKAGAMFPTEQAQPGDLLFWGYDESNPKTIHHVAIYIGDGQIVEAQQTGVPVHTRSVSWDESELLPQAIRPGV